MWSAVLWICLECWSTYLLQRSPKNIIAVNLSLSYKIKKKYDLDAFLFIVLCNLRIGWCKWFIFRTIWGVDLRKRFSVKSILFVKLKHICVLPAFIRIFFSLFVCFFIKSSFPGYKVPVYCDSVLSRTEFTKLTHTNNSLKWFSLEIGS